MYCDFVWDALHRFVYQPLRSLIYLVFSIRRTPEPAKVDASQPSDCEVFTITAQSQVDLHLLGVGAAGQVYEVDDDIVLKTCRVFVPPGRDTLARDREFYASETLFHFNLMENERTVLRLLEQRPHPNIAGAISTDYTEGLYLRRYLRLSELETPTYPSRILWYQDIICALLHIHKLSIAHSDLRIDNVLFDRQGRALLCDFSAASPFGQSIPAFHPDFPFPRNGLSEMVSDAIDRFAMGYLIFQLETGAAPNLSVDDHGTLVLPQIQTGHAGIDAMIRKAWLGEYNSTQDMLKHARSFNPSKHQDTRVFTTYTPSTESLKDRIRDWRAGREGRLGCVLRSLPTEEELKRLAEDHGLDKDADFVFRDYTAPDQDQ